MTSAQPLARALYVVLFDLKLLNKDGNWQVGMYCMHIMHKKEPEKPSDHTSEHVKFSGGVPPDPPHTVWAQLFLFALGPHNPLGGPAWKSKHWLELSPSCARKSVAP